MKISGNTRLLGFFGSPASHSLSPAIYNYAFQQDDIDMCYLAFDIDKSSIEAGIWAMRTLNMAGANVSMPCKEKVMEYVDHIGKEAKLIGAVNTIINENGRLIGENTDAYGIVSAVSKLGVDIETASFVILGCGGAAKSAIVGLCLKGAKDIKVAVRKQSEEKAKNRLEQLFASDDTSDLAHKSDLANKVTVINLENEQQLRNSLKQAKVLINATNVGMGTEAGKSLIKDISMLHENLFVVDMIYHPRETKLMEDARKAGIQCEHITNGLSMLLGQAERAYYLYTGKQMDVESVKEALIKDGLV